jgi:hypothetical protein
VVFISGINFIGYVLVKLIGTDKGIGLTGLVGGLASSTAVTLSFTPAQQSRAAALESFRPGHHGRLDGDVRARDRGGAGGERSFDAPFVAASAGCHGGWAVVMLVPLHTQAILR